MILMKLAADVRRGPPPDRSGGGPRLEIAVLRDAYSEQTLSTASPSDLSRLAASWVAVSWLVSPLSAALRPVRTVDTSLSMACNLSLTDWCCALASASSRSVFMVWISAVKEVTSACIAVWSEASEDILVTSFSSLLMRLLNEVRIELQPGSNTVLLAAAAISTPQPTAARIERIRPAIARPRPLPPILPDLTKPRMEKIRPRTTVKNKIKPAMAKPFFGFCGGTYPP